MMEILESYPWPGNVRELENVIQRMVIMSDGPIYRGASPSRNNSSLSAASQEAVLIPDGGVDFDEEMKKIEVAYLSAALRRAGGSKAGAARLLRLDAQRMKYLCTERPVGGRLLKI